MASNELKQEIQAALDNSTLARTLGNFCKTYPARRENSYAGVDFEKTRNQIKEVKSYAADHVDEMIEQFTANCEKRGGVVFHAHSTEEALRLAEKYPRTLVIGGASVYRQLLPWVDLVHVTKLDLAPASDSLACHSLIFFEEPFRRDLKSTAGTAIPF